MNLRKEYTINELFDEYPDMNWITEDFEVVLWESKPIKDPCVERFEYFTEIAKYDVVVFASEEMPIITDWGDRKTPEQRIVSRVK
jgi:hypothetical protein